MRSLSRTASGNVQLSRWMMMLVALAMAAALAMPMVPAKAQPASGDVIDVIPTDVLLFAQANLDQASDQAQLAMQLAERAGLTEELEDATGEEEIPNLQIGVAIVSFPEAAAVDLDAVSMDPMAATESLDEGGFAVVFSGEDAQSFLDEEREAMNGDAEFGYGTISESEYGGVEITAFESTDEFTDSSAIAMIGDFAVVGMLSEDLHPLIDTYNGDTDSLSTNTDYQRVNELLPGEYLANGWLNGPQMLEGLTASTPDASQMFDEATLAAADAYVGFTLSAEEQGFRVETRSITQADGGEPQQMLDGSFLDAVSSDALLVANGTNIDAGGAVTSIAQLFASELVGEMSTGMATPAGGEATDPFVEAEALLGFNLETDFIDNLVGEFGVVLSVSDITAEVPSVDALIVSDVSDSTTVQDVLMKISFIVGAGLGDQTAIESRDVDGNSVSAIDISDTGIADSVEYGVVNEEFVLSVGSGLDDYIAGPASPLSQDANFNELMSNLPSEYSSLTYLNLDAAMDLFSDFSDSMSFSVEDADPACGEFATQEDAQAALDEDPFGNADLDQDFDFEACEDYFAPAAATPAADEADPYQNIIGLASVSHEDDGVDATSTFLLIGDN